MQAIVKAVAKNPTNTPTWFPWVNGVKCNILLPDQENTLDNVAAGLKDIKAMINGDANKFGMALSDFDITIDFV